jgi:hypothetical protein
MTFPLADVHPRRSNPIRPYQPLQCEPNRVSGRVRFRIIPSAPNLRWDRFLLRVKQAFPPDKPDAGWASKKELMAHFAKLNQAAS